MVKITRILFLLVLIHANGFSQPLTKNRIKAGMGLVLAIPAYNLDISSTGGGVDAFAQYGLTDNIGITADAGFIGLPGKGRFPSTAIVPIRFGGRYYTQSKIYFAGRAGLGVYTILKASANHFAYSFGSGYNITKNIDASLFYDGFTNKNSSFGYVAIRAAYRF